MVYTYSSVSYRQQGFNMDMIVFPQPNFDSADIENIEVSTKIQTNEQNILTVLRIRYLDTYFWTKYLPLVQI